MDRHIKQVACARQFFVLSPGPACLGPIQEPLAAKVPWLAQRAAFHKMPHITHRRRKAVGESGHVHDMVVACRFVHMAHFAGIQTQRLLAHDMLAGGCCGKRDWFVRKVRCGDHHCVNRRILAYRFVVGGDFVNLPIGPPLI
jgi:hypothetical protein